MTTSDIVAVYPLSPIQEGLLFHAVAEPDSRAYFVQMRFDVIGALDEPTLVQAWNDLCARHDVLRTSFVHEGLDRPLQAVHASRPGDVRSDDLRAFAATAQQERIAEFCAADRARGFDLKRDVLTRIALLRTADTVHHLVWSYHHVLLDGWCLGLLQREFGELYAARAEGRVARLMEARPYRDYIAWLGTQDGAEARHYWSRALAGYETATTVPACDGAGASSMHECALIFDAELTGDLRTLATRSRVTLNTLVQTLWGVLLARYNDVDDVVFGSVVSGRGAELDGVERIVGPFINTVPTRVVFEPGATLAGVLARVQTEAIESAPYHHAKLAEIQASTTLGRGLFDHVFVFDNYPVGGEGNERKTGLRFRSVGAHDWTHYPFSIVVVPDERIHIKFLYDSATYGAAYVERIAGHLQTAARFVTRTPETTIAAIPILSGAEAAQLALWSGSAAGPDPDHTIVDAIEAQAARTPEVIALIFGEQRVTFGDLNARANALAAEMRAMTGFGAGSRIGVLLDRSIDLVIAIVAILKAGGAYVPIDPGYPAERVAFLVRDCDAHAVFADAHGRAKVPPGVAVLSAPFVEREEANLARAAGPDQLAYVLYTSGTTGDPKGCRITHASLLFYLTWANGYYFDAPTQGNFALFSPVSFDLTVTSLFVPLMRGTSLTILPHDAEPTQLLNQAFAPDSGVDTVKLTPSHCALLALSDLPSTTVRLAIVGGEALTAAHARVLWKLNPAMRIVNEYGPTEATVGCIVHEVRPTDDDILIGRPIAGATAVLLDRQRRLVPIGVTGEIWIGGPGVAQGYHRRPELDAERFVAGPGGERMYRTGDYGRRLESGDLACLGRTDDQVKIRGYRVELGEVERALERCVGVRRAVVVVSDSALVAFVESDMPLAPSELREQMRSIVPDHAVPAHVICVDAFPLSVNGKIDRLRLSAETTVAGTPHGTPPRDDTERAVAAIWTEVLGRGEVGVETNFFAAGGHSLKAMQAIARVRKSLGVTIPLRAFLADATIAATAALVRRGRPSPFAGIAPAPPQTDYPLSHAQQRLWFVHRMGGEIAYNMPEAFVVDGEVDTVALRAVLATLIERHEPLRTAFVEISGEPRQRIAERVAVPFVEIDLRGEADPETAARALAEREAVVPFALDLPPLLRLTVLRLAPARSVILLTIHHLVGDGWSMAVLHQEFLVLYAAFRRGAANPLPPLRVQYKDFAVWQTQRDHADGERYWMARLAGAPERLRLPYDRAPDESERDFRGATIGLRLDPARTAALRAFAAKKKTTLSNAVLTAFALTLWQIGRQNDFCIGVSEANRNDVETEALVGFFVNILPIRFEPSADMRLLDLFDRTVAGVYDAFDHRDYPFDLLVQKKNPGRIANRQPLLNVIYGFQSFRDVRVGGEGRPDGTDPLAQVSSFGVPFRTSKFDLSLFVSEVDDTLLLECEYDIGLFDAATIERLVAQIDVAAGQLSEDAGRTLADCGIGEASDESGERELLRALNDTATAYPRDATVPALFADMVRADPERRAVVFEATSMTYAELDRRSNDVAAFLIARGITADAFVGVLIDRSPEMIVAVLGILKAGAAYVPLSVELPLDRLRHIVDDTRMSVAIVEKRHVRIANSLQWECPTLVMLLSLDSENFAADSEADGGIMDAAVWDYVAEETFDDISGGGWKDSYTGEWLSREVMDEYGDNILAKLRPYVDANARVLEIGCASGISMFRLAPLIGYYVGTDLSPGIVRWSEDESRKRGLDNVRLHALAAHEIDRVGERDFDVVILNSVIECFPGQNYLRRVLRAAIGLMKDEGVLFLGNLWDQDLKAEFIASLIDFKREHPERSERMKLDRSDELYVSRAFLEDLRYEFPEIASIDYSTMLGSAQSELSRFGFDAVIRIRKGVAHRPPAPRRRFQFDRRALAPFGGVFEDRRGSAESLAYLMYTSGTSGQPKGVMIEQRAIVRLVRNTDFVQLGPMDAVLQSGALGFDASTFEIWAPLLNGGCVVLPAGKSFVHPAELARIVREQRVTVIFLTTGLFNQIVDLDPAAIGNVSVVLTGGERASPGHFNTIRARHPHLRLLHVYGPTENTTFSTWYPVEREHAQTVPIGRPIANATAIVVSERGALVPFGTPGELWVGGDGLARGYWRDAELTARKFRVHPLDPQQRMYRTGDLVRWGIDGEIEYLGRIDTQVKIRGYRIELEELEGVLLDHAQITGAAVIAGDFGRGEIELVAFVTGRALVEQTLIDHIKRMLPAYFVPSRIVIQPQLPLNTNGKVDRKRLRVPESARSAEPFAAPATPLEERLVDLWQRLLAQPRIGVTANFFALGGHSLKVARLVSMIQMELGFEISLSAVFAAPTIRELARALADSSRFDRRLLDDEIVPLNTVTSGLPVFAFPPGSGYALGYLRLATLVPRPFFGLSFIEADSRLADYVALIRAAQPSGPYVLFGYSAGGKLAFRVAQELERSGEIVSDLILFDAARYLEAVTFDEAELREVAAEFLDEIGSSIVRERALERMRRYRAFLGASVEHGTIRANVHLVVAEGSERTVRGEHGRTVATLDGWRDLTTGRFCEYAGSGAHREMLSPPHVERNVDIIRAIFASHARDDVPVAIP